MSRDSRISFADFRTKLLQLVSGKPCWYARKYLGSMLAVDFGGRVEVMHRGEPMEVGEVALSVQGCRWVLTDKGTPITDNDIIGIEDDGEVDHLLIGRVIQDFEKLPDRWHRIVFDDRVAFEFGPSPWWTGDLIWLRKRDAGSSAYDGNGLIVSTQGYLFERVAEE